MPSEARQRPKQVLTLSDPGLMGDEPSPFLSAQLRNWDFFLIESCWSLMFFQNDLLCIYPNLKYRFFDHLNKIGLIAFAPALGPHKDNVHTDRHLKPLFWALMAISKRKNPLKTQHGLVYKLYTVRPCLWPHNKDKGAVNSSSAVFWRESSARLSSRYVSTLLV